MTLAVALDVSAVPGDPRGAGRYVIELVRALGVRPGLTLHLEARRGDERRWREVASGATVAAVVPAPRPLRLAWEQLVAPRLVERWGVRVLHCPHYTMPERSRVPTVVTVHDVTYFDHPEWHERAKVAVFRRAIRVAARRAGAIVCVSERTRARLVELVAPRCPVHVVPHGVDHTAFREVGDGEADLAALGALGVRPPYIAFLGTLEPRKDVATLVRAFDDVAGKVPDVRLVVAGGRGWRNEAFERAVASSRHRKRILRTGYLPDEAVPALLRQAVAVAYPALEEGFGLPVLEALACGTPVVTTAGSVMDDVAAGAAATVPPGDVSALAAALLAVLAGDAEVEARRRSGLEVAARHTWEAAAAAHEAIYRSVASGGDGPR